MPRILLLLVATLLAVELAALLAIGWGFGWSILALHTLLSGLLGAGVICFALWHYGSLIADRLDNNEFLRPRTEAGVLLLIAGVMLLLPGLLTDFVGLVMLMPGTRRSMVAALVRRGNGSGL